MMLGCRIIVRMVVDLAHHSNRHMILFSDHKPLMNILRDPSTYLHSSSIKHKRWLRSIEDINRISINAGFIEDPLTIFVDYLSRCLDETDELLQLAQQTVGYTSFTQEPPSKMIVAFAKL
ncbi:hypothetical protein SARC_17720 [Sphaeroforma arctica JP610]|uniref:Uncharacterized protein n=1 Tax=Sphaeroforma arctica JP610 TaxID=667725 RepID=A0A0L0F0U0_9EUKA|nr:hypothetical protein SARC_17720 [Sphaeroforma arctica JP610]KNC69758.1 hypothetical protein SARC_17720 [Sphaeroforma arctica JP610]|eukprot:XP_014143660.1 hypothetical protein SARC_17720 [Sphaeroforma arctica JP610]